MDKKTRLYIYAFLSRVFTAELDEKALLDLQKNEQLLETIGQESAEWFATQALDAIEEALNVDYNTLFVMHNHPIESAVMDSKNEVLVGLQNPVMQFYFQHGYDFNLEQSSLYVPDHLAIELGFMQKLVSQDETAVQIEFMQQHLLKWIPPFLIGIQGQSQTPFYRELCDFTIEFLLSDYSGLCAGETENADAR